MDARRLSDIENGVKQAAGRFESIDIAIHNACRCTFMSEPDSDYDVYRDREQQLALAIEGPDVFFLKIALHIVFLQGSDGGKAVNRVSGKTADRLRDDQVDLPGEGIGYHAFEALTLFGVRPGDALVGIDTGELPIVSSLDVVGVVIDLRFVAGQLFFVIGADTSVGRHTSLLGAVDRCRREA